MGVLILGVNTLYRLFCFFKLFLMVGKGLMESNVTGNKQGEAVSTGLQDCNPYAFALSVFHIRFVLHSC